MESSPSKQFVVFSLAPYLECLVLYVGVDGSFGDGASQPILRMHVPSGILHQDFKPGGKWECETLNRRVEDEPDRWLAQEPSHPPKMGPWGTGLHSLS